MANLFFVSISSDLIKDYLTMDSEHPAYRVIKGIPEDSKLVNVLFSPVNVPLIAFKDKPNLIMDHNAAIVKLMFETNKPIPKQSNNEIAELTVECELV